MWGWLDKVEGLKIRKAHSPNKSPGWLQPMTGICYHYTAGSSLAGVRNVLANPASPWFRANASAHFGVGKNREEGIDQWVSFTDRSWHAGAGTQLAFGHQRYTNKDQRLYHITLGIEVVGLGRMEAGDKQPEGWVKAASEEGHYYWWSPYSEEQIAMLTSLTSDLTRLLPNLYGYRLHGAQPNSNKPYKMLPICGHSDACSARKDDPGPLFPFYQLGALCLDTSDLATYLERGDWWSPFSKVVARQQALILLGYDLGSWGADDDWGAVSRRALSSYLEDRGFDPLPTWGTWVAQAVATDLFGAFGQDWADRLAVL